MPPIKTFGERIADALVEDGLLFRKQVDELMELQKREGTRLLKIIIDKAYVTEQDMAVSMGRVLNTPPVNLSRFGIAPEIAELLPRDICQSHKVVPVSRLENKLFLAMADPLNVLAIDDVRRITRMEVAPMIASEKSIIDKLHNIESGKTGSMEDLASDIHIEPFERMVRLRYRVDGALLDKTPPPKNLAVSLISRLKIMSSLDIAERRLPQDGRMRVKVAGRDFDLRVSFLPTSHGEKCVLRILDKANLSASM